MAECSEAERELLDALQTNARADINELRSQVAIARITPEQWEQLFTLRAEVLLAQDAYHTAWERASHGVVSPTKAFGELYERIEKEARKRAGLDT